MEDKFYILTIEPDYHKNFSISYPEWRVKFEKALREMERERIRYVHTGGNSSFFIRFYNENREEEIKINLPLRLKKLGINPLYYFIPLPLLEPFTLILNLKIVFDEIKENFSGENTLYIPFIHRIPEGFSSLLKGFGIEFVFSKVELRRNLILKKEGENEIKIVNISPDSKVVFYNSFPVSSDSEKRFFSIEEILSGIPQKGETHEFKKEIELKNNFPFFKELENTLFKHHILNTIIKTHNPDMSDYFIKEKWRNLYFMFNSDGIERIKEEIKEIKNYGEAIVGEFIEGNEEFSIFNVTPYKFNYFTVIKNKLLKSEAEPFSFSKLSEENTKKDFGDFKVYERGNIKFHDLILSPKLIGEKGELKGGLYEEEIFKSNFLKTESVIKFSDREFSYSVIYIPHNEVVKIKGKTLNIRACEFNIFPGIELLPLEPSFIDFVNLNSRKIYSGYLILKGDNSYLIKTIPGTEIKIEEGKIKLIFEGNVDIEIKKVNDFSLMEFQKFKYSPILFRGSVKRELPPLFELKNNNINFLFMERRENTLYIYFYSKATENTRLLFRERPFEGFIYDLKAKRKIDRVQVKDKWVIIPPQKGIFCVGIDIRNIPLSIF